MIKIDKLSVKFQNQVIIDDLSFTFEQGIFYGLTGASGIGKTTLLGAIAGLVPTSHGAISSDFQKLGYIFQDARLFPWMTALENVECVCHDIKKAEYYLNKLLPNAANKFPHELSGGMKQRVSIARALSYDAPLLLLDEPFKGLDEETKQLTVDAVMEFIKGRTAILVSHDYGELALCDKILKMERSPVSSLTEVKSGSTSFE